VQQGQVKSCACTRTRDFEQSNSATYPALTASPGRIPNSAGIVNQVERYVAASRR
jgi:hypothetical protein